MPSGPSDLTPAVRASLRVVFFTVFLDLLGFGMVIPILPLYAKQLHASDPQVGLLLATYSAMQLFFAPVWGRLSDRIGRRPVLLVSILGSCLSQLGYALAPSYPFLVVARAIAGVCGANIGAAQAYVADVTDERSRAAGMGMLGAAFGAGFVFGPAMGGVMSRHFGPTAPFLLASALAALNFVQAVVSLVEPRAKSERSSARTITWGGLVRALSSRRTAVLIALFFVITFAFSNLEATLALYLLRRFGFESDRTAYLYAGVGVMMVVVQGGVVRRLVPRVGERVLVVAGTFLMALGMGLLYLAHGIGLLLAATVFVSGGNGLNTPSLSSLISRSAAGPMQGSVLGVAQSFGAMARIVGPLVGTWMLAFGVAMPYAGAGAVMLVASAIALGLVEQPPPAEVEAVAGEMG
jgi:multidrug resistance protein